MFGPVNFSFLKELCKNKFEYLIWTSKFKLSFRGLHGTALPGWNICPHRYQTSIEYSIVLLKVDSSNNYQKLHPQCYRFICFSINLYRDEFSQYVVLYFTSFSVIDNTLGFVLNCFVINDLYIVNESNTHKSRGPDGSMKVIHIIVGARVAQWK